MAEILDLRRAANDLRTRATRARTTATRVAGLIGLRWQSQAAERFRDQATERGIGLRQVADQLDLLAESIDCLVVAVEAARGDSGRSTAHG